jgi:hypothetical protein
MTFLLVTYVKGQRILVFTRSEKLLLDYGIHSRKSGMGKTPLPIKPCVVQRDRTEKELGIRCFVEKVLYYRNAFMRRRNARKMMLCNFLRETCTIADVDISQL